MFEFIIQISIISEITAIYGNIKVHNNLNTHKALIYQHLQITQCGFKSWMGAVFPNIFQHMKEILRYLKVTLYKYVKASHLVNKVETLKLLADATWPTPSQIIQPFSLYDPPSHSKNHKHHKTSQNMIIPCSHTLTFKLCILVNTSTSRIMLANILYSQQAPFKDPNHQCVSVRMKKISKRLTSNFL